MTSNDVIESPHVGGQENEVDRNEISKETGQKKMVHVVFSIDGDTWKGKIWAAKILGLDPKYGLKREFLNGEKTRTGKYDMNVYYDQEIEEGTIIQTSESGSRGNNYGNFWIVDSQ